MSTSSDHEALIYDGIRSAFGRHAGALSPIRPDDLLGTVIASLVEKNDFDAGSYEDVIVGNPASKAENLPTLRQSSPA